jgi:AsmA-like C-terminal region
MVGGTLEIAGDYLDLDPGEPLVGRLVARDYRVVNAPLLARLLSVAALTGILDELKGEGLNFSALELPFVQTEGLLELREARAFGASLGFTAAGKIYTDADIMDMSGTIVPAYAVNSLLGNLPLVGALFTGGEKGGGVFAATFRMTGPREDPNIAINPISTLAPGFLRNLFGIFGTAGREAPAREESR